jgi:HK97 gp10 family phage protein
MLKVSSRLKGSFDGALKRLEAEVSDKVCLSGAAAMARVLYTHAEQNAAMHRKTGKLESAIRRRFVEQRSSDKRKTYWVTWSPTVAPHGHFLEYGTSRAPAYPFIAPAFDHINEAIDAGKKQMAQRLHKETESGGET